VENVRALWGGSTAKIGRAVGAGLGRVAALTKVVQDWPKVWANFRALIEILSQSVGPRLAIWANPAQISFRARSHCRFAPPFIRIITPRLINIRGASIIS
jgi:hypothetical protein